MFLFENDIIDVTGYKSKWRDRGNGKWDDYETCKAEAAKFSNKSSFHYGSPWAYTAAAANKWLNDFFPSKQNRWNPETLNNELAKFDYNLDAVKRSNRDAYTAYCKLIRLYDPEDFDPYVDEIIKQIKNNN